MQENSENGLVFLTNVRLSFPKLIEPSSFIEGGAKKFSANFLMVPNGPNFAAFMGEVGKVATEKWKQHAGAVLQMVQNDRKLRCYGNGSEVIDKKTYQPIAGYENMVYISAHTSEDRPPRMVRTEDGQECDPRNTMERTALARKMYAGCYVNAVVRPWCQDNQYGRAIRCELIALQFFADGDPFGEGEVSIQGMFKPVAVQAPAAPAGAAPAMPPGFPAFFGVPPQQ